MDHAGAMLEIAAVGWAKAAKAQRRRPCPPRFVCLNYQLAADRPSCITDQAASGRSAKQSGGHGGFAAL